MIPKQYNHFQEPSSVRRQVIIVGYPKSGTTWLTRLVAELLDCPIKGFWNEPEHIELATEGIWRDSDFECFKSHHQFQQIINTTNDKNVCIIYIVRDPRDIILSGAPYFRFQRFPILRRILLHIPKGDGLYRYLVNTTRFQHERMLQVILRGDPELRWCIPWSKHVEPYLQGNQFIIRYEDLLVDPFSECTRILEHLNTKKSTGEVHKAIEKQSFNNRKDEFYKANDQNQYHFLRSGKAGEWREQLTKRQKSLVLKNLGNVLNKLDYPAK